MQAPHFARSLEWLLFTALDASSGGEVQPPRLVARPVTSTALAGAGQDPSAAGRVANGTKSAAASRPLLQAAADLVRQFPQASLCLQSDQQGLMGAGSCLPIC